MLYAELSKAFSFHIQILLYLHYIPQLYNTSNGILTESNNEKITTSTMIAKTAKTEHPINELIARRWSARAFSTRPVEKSKLFSILEAARWAPSSRNEQPWRYIVFTNDNPEKLKKAQSVLKDINEYAKRAPILICAIARKTYSDSNIYNRLHFHDLGAG